jgi:hypothetical protein
MKFSDLVQHWESASSGALTASEYHVRLPLRDAARIAALAEMYPIRSETEIISELLNAALDELEQAMHYVPGSRVIAEDDQGDPIYEDVGPTPRFMTLTEKYLRQLQSGSSLKGSPDS